MSLTMSFFQQVLTTSRRLTKVEFNLKIKSLLKCAGLVLLPLELLSLANEERQQKRARKGFYPVPEDCFYGKIVNESPS